MNDKSDKAEIRSELLRLRDELDDSYIESSNKGIYSVLSGMPEFSTAPVLFAYYSIGREVDTNRIIELAFALGKKVALPISFKGGIMEFHEIEEDGTVLVSSVFGIPEPQMDTPVLIPQAEDILLVPALSFDTNAYRVGYGGGYYDRFLASCPAFTVGLGRHALLRPEVPREIHDLPAKCLITETGIIKRYKMGSHHDHDCEHDCDDCDQDCDNCDQDSE